MIEVPSALVRGEKRLLFFGLMLSHLGVQRALYSLATTIQDVSIDHSSFHVLVTE